MTDNTLRTAIARALFEAYGDTTSPGWDAEYPSMKRTYFDQADAVLAVLAVPDEETVERAAQAEHWHDFEQGDALLTWDLMTEMARGFYMDEARRMLRAAFDGGQV